MTQVECLAKHVGSLRYARDIIEGGVLTMPWWDTPSMVTIPEPQPERERVIPCTNESMNHE